MAGSIQLSGSQQFDAQGVPLSGGLLYFFASGTTTPQNAFQDQALSIPYSNPIVLDASGRVPFFYLADGNIKIRLTDKNGVTVITADGLLVIGPSSGGGGGGGVDATTILATGDVKARYGTGILSGFVRLNGRTVGSATSGGTERANADAQALFEYLWGADPNLTVSSGRGASANADWLANKTIALPDLRGRVMAGLDDMGASAASRLTTAGLGTSATVLGASGGAETKTLATAELPAHAHEQQPSVVSGGTKTVTSAQNNVNHTHAGGALRATPTVGGGNSALAVQSGVGTIAAGSGGATTFSSTNFLSMDQIGSASAPWSGATAIENQNHTHDITLDHNTGNTGSGTAFSKVVPTMVLTFYMKL